MEYVTKLENQPEALIIGSGFGGIATAESEYGMQPRDFRDTTTLLLG